MALKIRLSRGGAKKRPFYKIVVAEALSPRDGKFIEDLGYYDPHHNPSKVEINVDKAVSWLDKGAQPSERAQKLLEISGAWAQWRSSKGEVVSIPTAPAEKVKSSSKANKKKEEATQEETSEESSEDTEEE